MLLNLSENRGGMYREAHATVLRKAIAVANVNVLNAVVPPARHGIRVFDDNEMHHALTIGSIDNEIAFLLHERNLRRTCCLSARAAKPLHSTRNKGELNARWHLHASLSRDKQQHARAKMRSKARISVASPASAQKWPRRRWLTTGGAAARMQPIDIRRCVKFLRWPERGEAIMMTLSPGKMKCASYC